MKDTKLSNIRCVGFLGMAIAIWLCTNSVSQASQGDAFFENSSGSPLIGLLQGAKTNVDIEIYEMDDLAVSTELRAALDRGVKLNIIQEGSPVGASCHVFGGSTAPSSQTPDCLKQQDLVKYITSHGGQYVPFSKSLCGKTGSKCFQHGKIAIVDSTTALISTGNFNATSLCDRAENPTRCDRDYTFLSGDRSIISSLQTIFANDLQGSSSDLNNIGSSRLTVSPNSMKPLLDFIGSARNTLQIETQYLEDPTMNQAIVDAAKRGVKVSVMVSSGCSFGKPTPTFITKWTSTYTTFDGAGIKTWVFNKRMNVGGLPGYLHAKAIIVDGKHAWMGSINGSTTSIADNREYGIFLDDSKLVSELNQFVTSDFNNNQRQSWQDSIACK